MVCRFAFTPVNIRRIAYYPFTNFFPFEDGNGKGSWGGDYGGDYGGWGMEKGGGGGGGCKGEIWLQKVGG